MIPASRPVMGKDLLDLKEKLCLTTAEMLFLLGLSMPKWGNLTRRRPDGWDAEEEGGTRQYGYDEPVPDASLAILVRLLDQHPELCPIKPPMALAEFVDRVEGTGIDVDRKNLGPILGRDRSAGYRWLSEGTDPTPVVRQLMSIVLGQMEQAGNTGFFRQLESWAEQEAQARGVDDLLRDGRWRDAGKAKKN